MSSGIVISVSDGKAQASLNAFSIEVLAEFDEVEAALRTGDASIVINSQDLVDEALETILDNDNVLKEPSIKLFNLNNDGTPKNDGSSLTAIDWNPTHDASVLTPTYGFNSTVLFTNAVTKSTRQIYKRTLAIAGQQKQARYLVMGSNPFRNAYRGADVNEQMHQFMENSLSWLSGRDDLKTTTFNVVIAQMHQNYYFPDEVATRQWLDQRYPGQVNYNKTKSCDSTQLAACLSQKPDLLIISQQVRNSDDVEAIAEVVRQAMQQGTSVLYTHLDGNETRLGHELFSVFNVNYFKDNYWANLRLTQYDPTQDLNEIPAHIADIQTMLTHFRNQDYAIDWSACIKEDCRPVSSLIRGFQKGADTVRSMMKVLDESKLNLFGAANEDGFRLEKLLLLLGDHYRQSVHFPMDKNATNDTIFLQSLYADHAVYNYRTLNPAQADMGNFSRSDFSHITAVTKTVSVESKRRFRAAGVYALPGQTFRVTRQDSSAVNVTIFINTLRSGSTHEYGKNKYIRPKYLQSPKFKLAPGETIELTSPYGGPLQIGFNKNNLQVQLQFENIGEHPFWKGEEDNDRFDQKIAAGEYDWAEISTPGFEVHSTLKKMRESLNFPQWGDAATLAEATMRYMHNFPHALAGFKGPGIDVIPEVESFASDNGWEIKAIDLVKHMNADQALCGYGCSGNPYDAYWAFNPQFHGDLHELGHGLQGGKRFIGWPNHSMTNYYSYFSKWQYFKDTGNDAKCQGLPFDNMRTILQNSLTTADPAAYVKANLWNGMGWNDGAGMFVQMMMSAQNSGALQDGWLLRTFLHIYEREYDRAKRSEPLWLQERDNLGFDQYSWNDIKVINNNDWYLIAVSRVTQMDYSDYFDMWALTHSAKAGAQVAIQGYPMTSRRYYLSESKAYCFGLDKPSILLGGQ